MVVRSFRAVVAGTALVGAIVAGAGPLGSSGASAASSFSLTGTLMVANANTHRISVLVGGSRHSIVVTARARVLSRQHQMTMFALQARMRVSVQGLVRSRWREALVIPSDPVRCPFRRCAHPPTAG